MSAYEAAYGDHAFEEVQARFRKRMLTDLLQQHQPSAVLEVGCGLDSFANHWTAADRFIVVEPRESFASAARAQTGGRGDVTVLEGTLESVAAQLDRQFDLILLSGLLNEIEDCDTLLGAVRGLCSPSTVIHANVPNAHSFHRLLAVEMGLIKAPTEPSEAQKAFGQPWAFTLDTLTALVESQGFAVFERGSYFIKPFSHAQMEQLQVAGFLTPGMLEGLWNMARHMPQLGSEIFVNLRLAS